MSEYRVGRHAKPKPTGTSALRSATAQAGGKRSRQGEKTRAAIKAPGRKGAQKKARRRVNSENVKTALWLWCFPVGLSKMWRAKCTWPKWVKVGITAAMAAVLVAIFVVPAPSAKTFSTGVQLVANRPEVEVYGPALPTLIVQGYTRENTGSIIVDEVKSNVHYVYAADDADCYHEYECKFAFASSQRLTVYEAYHLGFKPCGRCKPPVYVPGETDPVTALPLNGGTVETVADAVTEEGVGETTETVEY